MLTVLGQFVAPAGHALHANAVGDVTSLTITEPLSYRRHQPADVAVHLQHDLDWTLGHVTYLERSQRFGLTAVATITADIGDLLDDGDWYWSDRITSQRLSRTRQRSNVQLHELSLVRATANCGTRPVLWAAGDLDGEPRRLSLWQREIWQRAAAARNITRYRSAAEHLDIFDVDQLDIPDEWRTDPMAARARLRAAVAQAPASTRDDSRVRRRTIGRVTSFQ